ncbi:SMI1/KNR4 family protein [Flavisphingomonas formosensis]|uniref:SMI1/KNR4 family protein n=1 Tax=Flavisphingomonas formosensis TaxID=861534 RepID=UPI0012FCD9F2|nr:SMI1/KNR4 family protein [Sphingomonas formosensis]
MKNSAFKLYESDQLPTGFIYPKRLKHISESGDYPNIAPWWFIDAISNAGRLVYTIRKHDGRNLVPFAKIDDGSGDIACLDGDDKGGNPAVLMLILDDSGRRYSYKDFEDWINSAISESKRF